MESLLSGLKVEFPSSRPGLGRADGAEDNVQAADHLPELQRRTAHVQLRHFPGQDAPHHRHDCGPPPLPHRFSGATKQRMACTLLIGDWALGTALLLLGWPCSLKRSHF